MRDGTPPTPGLTFDSLDIPDEETGSSNKPKSVGFVGFAPDHTDPPDHPLAISSVEVNNHGTGHRREVSELGTSADVRDRLTVGSSILASPETVMHMRTNSRDSDVVEKTEHISRHHVRNVFRGSMTVGTVNYEQIERIKKSEL